MKKLLAMFFTAVMMIAAFAVALAVSAETELFASDESSIVESGDVSSNPAEVVVEAVTGSAEAERGERVKLRVTLSNAITVKSGGVAVQYDESRLKLVSGQWMLPDALIAAFDMKTELGAFAFLTDSEISGDIFEGEFEVLKDAPLGDVDVSCVVKLKTKVTGTELDIEGVLNTPGRISVICRHTFGRWKPSDTDMHMHERTCTKCGATESGPHTFANETTLKCSECGFTYALLATTDKVEAERGEQVALRVVLSKNVKVKAGGVEVIYDKSKLKLISTNWLVENPILSTFDMDNDTGSFAYESDVGISGAIFEVSFEVSEDVKISEELEVLCRVKLLEKPDNVEKEIAVRSVAGKIDVICRHTCDFSQGQDSERHWGPCSKCGEVIYEDHFYEDDCDERCDACGYIRTAPHKYSGPCDEECDQCGARREPPVPHTYTDVCDGDCNVCGTKREAPHDYAGDCDEECDRCGARREPLAPHTYTDACDGDCDVCGFEREAPHALQGTWSYDWEHHWHECELCGLHFDEDEHRYSEYNPSVCEVCGCSRAIRGDLNGDGVVDTDDAVRLLMHVLYPDQPEYEVNQDCNFDANDAVDSDDAIYLLMHVLYSEQYPLPE